MTKFSEVKVSCYFTAIKSVQNKTTKADKTDVGETSVAASSHAADGYTKEVQIGGGAQQQTIDTSSQKLKRLRRVLSDLKVRVDDISVMMANNLIYSALS